MPLEEQTAPLKAESSPLAQDLHIPSKGFPNNWIRNILELKKRHFPFSAKINTYLLTKDMWGRMASSQTKSSVTGTILCGFISVIQMVLITGEWPGHSQWPVLGRGMRPSRSSQVWQCFLDPSSSKHLFLIHLKGLLAPFIQALNAVLLSCGCVCTW